MQLKKLAALAVSFVMAAGVCGVIPVNTALEGISVSASAASDFTVKTDSDGLKYVSKYNGKGGSIKIPDEVSYIGANAFNGNENITSVTFPASCDFIGEDAFAGCTRLTKVVFEGDADICQGGFYKCISLQSVTINGSIRDGIGTSAFSNCQSLTTVKIKGDENKFWIGEYAFLNCYSLTNINIPSKCTEIFGGAFLNCFSLTKLTIPANTEINENEGIGNFHFGYAMLFPTEEDCIAFIEGEEDFDADVYVAGGKTGYSEKYTRYPGTSYLFYYEAAQYTPKAITLTVTKGSPAADWAKEKKVKYTYAAVADKESSSSDGKLSAPTDINASSSSSRVLLSWEAVSGADAYRVYIYNTSTGKYEKYKDVSGTKCTVSGLESGTSYKFKVAALKGSTGKYTAGKASKPFSVKTKS